MRQILIFFIFLGPLNVFAQTDDAVKSNPEEIDVSEDIITLEAIIVETELETKTTQQTLDGTQLRRFTSSASDPFRAMALLPSVGTINDFLGVLSVRGGAPGDNLYYFDRLPLGYPYHLLGIVSVVSSEAIGKVDVYPGGFGAEFGADSQAVIDIHSRQKNMNALGRFDGMLKPSVIYWEASLSGSLSSQNEPAANASTEVPNDETAEKPARTDQEYLENKALPGQGYWYAFGRRSSLEPFFELASRLVNLEDLIRTVPSFWSYQLKGVYKINGAHGIVLNAVTAYDSAELHLGSKEVHDSDLRGPANSEHPFDVQGVHLYSQLLPRFRSILSFTRSFTETELAFGEGYYYRTAASTYALRNDFTWTTSSENTDVEFGYLLSSTPSTVTSHGARQLEEGDPDYEYRIRHNFETVNVTETQNLHRLEGYLQARQNLFISNLSGTLGIRASYFNFTDTLSVQPRGQLRYSLPWEAFLYFSYGRYAQNPRLDQFVLGVTPNSSLEQSFATHYVLELRQRLPFGANVNIASYYKTLRDLISYNKSDRQYQNNQVGFVRGFEVSLGYKISKAFDAWMAYAYTVSKRRDLSERFHRFYTYNSPHVLTLAASYTAPPEHLLSIPLIKALDISAKWQYQSGVLYATLVDRTLYTNPRTKEKKWRPIYGEWKRNAPYHRLDLSLRFKVYGDLEEQGWELGFALEVWNLYNRDNILEVRYSRNFTKEEPISQLPIIPFVAITLEF